MNRKFRFSVGEWYHCYSRGVDKRPVFMEEYDKARFHELLYLANDAAPLRLSEVEMSLVFRHPRTEAIVSVGAYALMGNHYHLILKEIRDGGITTFMRKLGTAYTMYFNQKYERVGNLFVKPFRAKHLDSDLYFQRAVQYVHANPLDLLEKGMNVIGLVESLMTYRYSSFVDFYQERAAKSILGEEVFRLVARVSSEELVTQACEYRRALEAQGDTLCLPCS